MRSARILAWVVIAIMGANLANVLLNSGVDHGVGFDTFLAGASNPWQLFINNDLVTGLLFMVGWIILRERGGRGLDIVAWVWMVLWWGNIIVAAYVLRAIGQAQGDWSRFFLGQQVGVIDGPPLSRQARLLCGLAALAVLAWAVTRIAATGGALIPVIGYILGFVPIILSFALLALPAKQA
ncbi:MAG: hypothetical protein ACSLE1_00310 [Sphingobium sp.]